MGAVLFPDRSSQGVRLTWNAIITLFAFDDYGQSGRNELAEDAMLSDSELEKVLVELENKSLVRSLPQKLFS